MTQFYFSLFIKIINRLYFFRFSVQRNFYFWNFPEIVSYTSLLFLWTIFFLFFSTSDVLIFSLFDFFALFLSNDIFIYLSFCAFSLKFSFSFTIFFSWSIYISVSLFVVSLFIFFSHSLWHAPDCREANHLSSDVERLICLIFCCIISLRLKVIITKASLCYHLCTFHF